MNYCDAQNRPRNFEMAPRFLFILSVHANLVRAALVTRDLRIASSAHKTFQISKGAFDPAQVWFQAKRVTAACFDIGRTLPREIITSAVVSDDDAWVMWQDNGGQVEAAGFLCDNARAPMAVQLPIERFLEYAARAPIYGGTLRAWLLWNLSGEYVIRARELEAWRAGAAGCSIGLTEPRVQVKDSEEDLKIRARGPFAADLAIGGVYAAGELFEPGQEEFSPDQVILRAAARISPS